MHRGCRWAQARSGGARGFYGRVRCCDRAGARCTGLRLRSAGRDPRPGRRSGHGWQGSRARSNKRATLCCVAATEEHSCGRTRAEQSAEAAALRRRECHASWTQPRDDRFRAQVARVHRTKCDSSPPCARATSPAQGRPAAQAVRAMTPERGSSSSRGLLHGSSRREVLRALASGGSDRPRCSSAASSATDARAPLWCQALFCPS